MTIERAAIPTDESRPGWRRACLAYRQMRRAGASDQQAHEAAVATVQSMWPVPFREASIEAINAVAYATRYHSEWVWQGLAKLKGAAD